MYRHFIRLLTVFCLTSLSSCAGGKADFEGRVTSQGKPVFAKSVLSIYYDDGSFDSVEIGDDGKFLLPQVKPGRVKIAVSNFNYNVPPASESGGRANVSPVASKQAPPAGWFAFPNKYSDPEQSGLSKVLVSGRNKEDIKLD